MPAYAAMDGFFRDPLVPEAQPGVKGKKGFLAGEDQPQPSRLPGIPDQMLQQPCGITSAPPARAGGHPEDHLPGSVLPVERGVGVHFVPKVRLRGAEAVQKGDEVPVLPKQKKMLRVDRQPPGQGLPVRRLLRGKAESL